MAYPQPKGGRKGTHAPRRLRRGGRFALRRSRRRRRRGVRGGDRPGRGTPSHLPNAGDRRAGARKGEGTRMHPRDSSRRTKTAGSSTGKPRQKRGSERRCGGSLSAPSRSPSAPLDDTRWGRGEGRPGHGPSWAGSGVPTRHLGGKGEKNTRPVVLVVSCAVPRALIKWFPRVIFVVYKTEDNNGGKQVGGIVWTE